MKCSCGLTKRDPYKAPEQHALGCPLGDWARRESAGLAGSVCALLGIEPRAMRGGVGSAIGEQAAGPSTSGTSAALFAAIALGVLAVAYWESRA